MKTTYPELLRLPNMGFNMVSAMESSPGSNAPLTNTGDLPSSTMRFGTFEIDLESRELRKQGVRIRLEEKPFRILAELLEHAGRVVTRKTLQQKLWPDTHVRYDQNLNTAVNKLRELLSDSAQSPRFIETLPRLGYRFVAPVTRKERTPPLVVIASDKKMLAVLPFENLGSATDREYFADGLTEELISHLGQINPKRFGVIGRTSAIQYKSTKKSILEIAAELKVGYILEGTVRCEGTCVRITVQLIEAPGQTHLWAASYNREFRDILGVQADVARAVGRALALELLPEDPSACVSFHPVAHESYLRGRFFFGQRTEEALKKAITSFETALSIETNCARSLSGIADCNSLLCWFGALAPKEAGAKAAASATRAVEIDASLSEPHASLALARFWYERDWRGAEEEFLRAIELNPSYASAFHWYASYLNAMGRLDEAQTMQRRARELDPLSLMLNMGAADSYFFARQYDRAIEHLSALLQQEPRFFPAHFTLGRVYVANGMHEQAIEAFEKAVEYSRNQEALAPLAQVYAQVGKTEKANALLEEMIVSTAGRYLAAPMIARVHLGLGEVERALDWLQKGLEERSYWMVFLKMDPVYDPIRSHPRFKELLTGMRLD